VTSALIARYVDARQQEGAKNATINREMAALKRMFNIANEATPPKVHRVPSFPMLKENNVRTGFLTHDQYQRLVDGTELWFRALVACGYTYGWRVAELLLRLRVNQIDLAQRSIRLEAGTTKNDDGREVVTTSLVHALLSACVMGKKPDDWIFTRPNGKRVSDFRGTWQMQCVRAGLGQLACRNCSEPTSDTAKCKKCGFKGTHYTGLIFHDLRRSAARNLRSAGVPETVIMKIGGWKTNSVFRRYAIVNRDDIADAMQKLEIRESELRDKCQFSASEPKTAPLAGGGMVQ
jgi:integrase